MDVMFLPTSVSVGFVLVAIFVIALWVVNYIKANGLVGLKCKLNESYVKCEEYCNQNSGVKFLRYIVPCVLCAMGYYMIYQIEFWIFNFCFALVSCFLFYFIFSLTIEEKCDNFEPLQNKLELWLAMSFIFLLLACFCSLLFFIFGSIVIETNLFGIVITGWNNLLVIFIMSVLAMFIYPSSLLRSNMFSN